jgi:hypothetical protein
MSVVGVVLKVGLMRGVLVFFLCLVLVSCFGLLRFIHSWL